MAVSSRERAHMMGENGTPKAFQNESVLRAFRWISDQLRARRNLRRLGDSRCLSPALSGNLLRAATVWPDVLPARPRTVVDIGAYRGVVAQELSELYSPQFIALVEPQPALAAALEQMVLAPRQKVFPCAIGTKPGWARLNVLESGASSSLLSVSEESETVFGRSMKLTGVIDVPTRTLDEVFAECGIDELDLLKVDVQGSELEVFLGGRAALRQTRTVVVEMSFFEHYIGQPLFSEVYGCLDSFGFGLRATFGFLYDAVGRPLQCDAVFVNLARLG